MHESVGQHWILLRGLCREAAHWGEFPTMLQTTFPGSTVTTLDLPGTGQFYRELSPSRIEAITQHIQDQAIANGLLAQPVCILALSLGGMVAWEWLSRHPQDIAAAVLVNTSFANLSPFYRRLRWQSYGEFVGLLLKQDVFDRELAIIGLVSNRRDHDQETAARWAQIQRNRPISVANCLRQLKAAASYRPRESRPETPILLLNGRGDRLVSPTCSDAIYMELLTDMATHPWGGHDLCLDDAPWVLSQIRNWIDPLKG